MEKIASFTIDHLKLLPGVYVSRKDKVGQQVITTFDIRMTRPNFEPVLNTAEVHTIEHLGATFLRNDSEFKDKTIYFGPMGCRTGFYMVLAGDYDSKDVVELVTRMFIFMKDFEGDVPLQTIGRFLKFCEYKRFFVFRYASYSYRAGAIYKLVKQAFNEQAHKSSLTNLCTACSDAYTV